MPVSPIIDLSHSPPRNVVDKYPQDEWNRGQYRSNHAAGMPNRVPATQRSSAYSRYGVDSEGIWR